MIADYDAALTKHRFDLLCSGGTLRALIETELRGETFWIENIAVDTALHGEGIGRSLLDLAKSIAIEQGCNHLRLCTNAKMARNIVIYKKYGFQIDREEVVSHGTVIYMSIAGAHNRLLSDNACAAHILHLAAAIGDLPAALNNSQVMISLIFNLDSIGPDKARVGG